MSDCLVGNVYVSLWVLRLTLLSVCLQYHFSFIIIILQVETRGVESDSCRRKTTPHFFLTWTFSQFSQTHCQEAFGRSCCCLEVQHHMCLWNRQKYNCSNLYLTSVTWSLMDSPDVSAAPSLSGRHNRGISGCLENTDQINKTSWRLLI